MGKIENFSINLDRSRPVYLSGEILSGSLHLKAKERMKINCLKLIIKGHCQVMWKETQTRRHSTHYQHGSSNVKHVVTCKNSENYMEFSLILLGSKIKDAYLEAGISSFPFKITLPNNLPSSFEHHIGFIRYSLLATIEIPWAFDVHSSKTFSVVDTLDLNMDRNLSCPLGANGIKQFCCGPCKSDPILINFKISKSGFVPGEKIPFTVQIENKSSKKISQLEVRFNQRITFNASKKSKNISRTISTIKCPKVIETKSNENWQDEILIPPICPTSNGSCRIIQIFYDLSIEFGSSGLSFNENLQIPIVIGTIPIRCEKNKDVSLAYEVGNFKDEKNQILEIRGEVYSSDIDSFRPFYPFYDFNNIN